MRKILIVDDDEDTLNILNQLLSKEFDCSLAENFDEFIKAYEQGLFDLVLSDLNLGQGKNATDVCKHVNKKTPVVVMTGGGESKLQQKVLKNLGCKEVLIKPFTKDEIVEIFASLADE